MLLLLLFWRIIGISNRLVIVVVVVVVVVRTLKRFILEDILFTKRDHGDKSRRSIRGSTNTIFSTPTPAPAPVVVVVPVIPHRGTTEY